MLRGPGRVGQSEGTYCKQDEVLLVVLAHTVIDPGTVVVHLPNAPLTHTETATGGALAGAWPPARCGLQGLQVLVTHQGLLLDTQWVELTWRGCSRRDIELRRWFIERTHEAAVSKT